MKPVSYLQTDPRWSGVDYSAPGEKTNIGESGCGCACTAMVIATLRDPKVTPVDTCKWSLEHGYKALKQGTYYSYFVPQLKAYDIPCERLNFNNLYGNKNAKVHETVRDYLARGYMVIACMGRGIWTKTGHYILAYGLKGDKVLINDPNSTKASRTCAPWETFISQVKYYFVIKEVIEMRYKYLADVPESFRGIIETLMDAGIIRGDGNGVIDLSHDQVRTLVFIYRGGGFDRQLKQKGFTPVVSE